jgi:hypothetical protein
MLKERQGYAGQKRSFFVVLLENVVAGHLAADD